MVEDELRIVGEVALATVLAGLVGWERERASKPAGLRTHMLVAASAALFVGLGQTIVHGFASEALPSIVRSDPIRTIEAIIVGISFLGAGTIIRHESQERVEGLTTAASILAVAGIGIAVGLGAHIVAGAVTVLILVVLRVVGKLEHRWKSDD